MKFSVFTASTPQWTPAEAAVILAGQGWDGIEWRVTDQEGAAEPGFWAGNRATWPLTGLEENLPAMAKITREAGLEFSGIGAYVRTADRDNVRRVLAATAELGAHRVRLTMPGVRDGHYRDLFSNTRAELDWAVGLAREYGVMVLVELHHRTIIASAAAALRLVDGLDPAHVGVIHDIGNLVIEGQEDALSGFEMLGEYLAHVHVKNVAWYATGKTADGATIWTEDWATLRDGQADIGAYFRALSTYGYDGWVTLEDFSTRLPLEQRTSDNLAYVRELRAAASDG